MHQRQHRIGKQRPQPDIKLSKLRKRQLLPRQMLRISSSAKQG